MKCPKCKKDNVTIQMMETGSKAKKTSIGLGGHINNAARTVAAVSTLGMSNPVWQKAKGEEKTKTKMEKVCLCQNCGYSWTIK